MLFILNYKLFINFQLK